jgi:hypothetical protein
MVRNPLFILAAMLIIAAVALIHQLAHLIVENTGIFGGLIVLAITFAVGAIAAPHLDR